MKLAREGYSTGTCAAAAAKAAALVLTGQPAPQVSDVPLPDGTRACLPVLYAHRAGDAVESAVKKDAGDDPDVTDAATVVATVSWADGADEEPRAEGQTGETPTAPTDIVFAAGEGVGTVTKPGLSVPPGEPAINPVPRQMIQQAVREVTERAVRVTLSIPGGRELAAKTFNPRLGVVGGLSILGTTGRVRPFSHPALQAALKCSVDVAVACGVGDPVLVPGHIGERAAHRHFDLRQEQVIEVSNEWGFMLELVARAPFRHILVLGHPGKLAKLAERAWDTHSSRSGSAVPIVARLGHAVLGRALPEAPTVEGLFAALPPQDAVRVGDALAARVRDEIAALLRASTGAGPKDAAVVLVNMRGEWLGSNGDLSPWQRRK